LAIFLFEQNKKIPLSKQAKPIFQQQNIFAKGQVFLFFCYLLVGAQKKGKKVIQKLHIYQQGGHHTNF
jgi:hypothetical protein